MFESEEDISNLSQVGMHNKLTELEIYLCVVLHVNSVLLRKFHVAKSSKYGLFLIIGILAQNHHQTSNMDMVYTCMTSFICTITNSINSIATIQF